MVTSQINILNEDDQFNYQIEYINDAPYISNRYSYTSIGADIVFCRDGELNSYISDNEFIVNSNNPNISHLPHWINESSINIYFPQWSVETYSPGGRYNISIYTYICGLRVTLASYIINRCDVLAAPKPRKIKNTDYYEYINVKFIDPWYLCYGDDWKDWRHEVCGEPENINTEGSLLVIELTPIEPCSSHNYRLKSPYIGGTTSMPLGTNRSDILYTDVNIINTFHTEPYIHTTLKFNKEYRDDVVLYMDETYGLDISNSSCRVELVLKDENNIYQYISKTMNSENGVSVKCDFSKSDLNTDDYTFDWKNYVPGMELVVTYAVSDGDDDIFTSISEPIPMTPELYKFFIQTDVPFINLDHINMHEYHLDVVNKINKTVVSVNKPDDYKTNIVKPIFIQSYPINNIQIHPQVTENICINLNSYKNTVDIFYLRIEGVDFMEVGRTAGGVVFKVIGSMLRNEEHSGIFYILNKEKELVVTGNYNYIQ